jgi:hypothetical protein
MADDVDACVESALQKLVNVMEKSGNLRNDLRKDILNSVSELRKSFAKMKCEVLEKNEDITSLQNEVKKSKDGEKHREVERVQAAPSVNGRRKYSEVVGGDRTEARNENIYSLILKVKQNESTDKSDAEDECESNAFEGRSKEVENLKRWKSSN